jgi:hypothetical protein
MKTKGMWPSSPRDALVLSFITKLEDGRYMNVTQSIPEHKDYQPVKGDVRMTAAIAGIIVGPHPTNPKFSRCIQIMDGDLGGWLPTSVVSLVTTQAFPISMRRANSKLKTIPNQKTISTLIEQSEGRGTVSSSLTRSVEKSQVAKKRSVVADLLKYLVKSQPIMVFFILVLLLRRR